MYYYYNVASGESQWEYPELPPEPPAIDVPPAPSEPPSSSMIDPAVSMGKAPLVSPAHGFSRDPVQTNTSIKKKKRPVKEDSPDIEDPYRDPYRQVKRTKNDIDDYISGSPSGVTKGVIAAAPQILRQRESSPVITQNPPLPQEESSDGGTQSPLRRPKEEKSNPINKPKLKKKKKIENTSGGLLPNKKLKHVSSLVQKWQTVKQQVEEEENVELESEDEDYEQASERRIEEWKKEIESSGMKEANPNFTEIKGNWRERLLKRKT